MEQTRADKQISTAHRQFNRRDLEKKDEIKRLKGESNDLRKQFDTAEATHAQAKADARIKTCKDMEDLRKASEKEMKAEVERVRGQCQEELENLRKASEKEMKTRIERMRVKCQEKLDVQQYSSNNLQTKFNALAEENNIKDRESDNLRIKLKALAKEKHIKDREFVDLQDKLTIVQSDMAEVQSTMLVKDRVIEGQSQDLRRGNFKYAGMVDQLGKARADLVILQYNEALLVDNVEAEKREHDKTKMRWLRLNRDFSVSHSHQDLA